MTWSHLWVQQMDQGILTVWFKLHHAHHQNKSIHMVLLTCCRAAMMTERKRLHAPSYSLNVLIICCETHCFSLLLHIRWSGKFRLIPKAFIRFIFRSMCTQPHTPWPATQTLIILSLKTYVQVLEKTGYVELLFYYLCVLCTNQVFHHNWGTFPHVNVSKSH